MRLGLCKRSILLKPDITLGRFSLNWDKHSLWAPQFINLILVYIRSAENCFETNWRKPIFTLKHQGRGSPNAYRTAALEQLKLSHVDNNKWKDFPLAGLLETALLGAYALYSLESEPSSWIGSPAMYSWQWFSPNLTGAPTQPEHCMRPSVLHQRVLWVWRRGRGNRGRWEEGGNPHLHSHHTMK